MSEIRPCENNNVLPYTTLFRSHHDAPPVILHVPLQLDAERAVIPAAVESAVNFARLENEPAPLAQADDLFHPLRVGGGRSEEHTSELQSRLQLVCRLLLEKKKR